MNKELVVKELISLVNRNGLIDTLYVIFGKKINVTIPFSQKACETPIDDLEFSVRANNAMKRSGIFTVGEAIELIENDGLLRIKNLGKKTQNEIKTRILVYAYQKLTESEKKRFFYEVLEKNCA